MDTRKSILNIAQRYVQEKGYNGFSLQAVADEAQIRKASLFHHFPSKENLVVSVVERYTHWFYKWDEKTITPTASIWEKFEQFFEIYRYFRKEGTLVCPLTMLAAEYATLTEPVQKSIRNLLREIELWIERQLELAKKSGELTAELQTEHFSKLLAATLTGNLSFSRIDEDNSRFETQLKLMMNQLKFYSRKRA